jgi:hypothetical protein
MARYSAVGSKGLSRLGGSECGVAGLLEGDQAAGELEQREVVLVFLRPADQQRPVAVQPRVAGFDDPTAGAPSRRVELELDLFAAGTDLRCEAALGDGLAHGRVVVAAVETQSLRLLLAWPGPFDRDRVECRA